jgi:hypothetical protein
MSQRRKRASSETPEVDYVVNGLEVLGRAMVEATAAVVRGACIVVCCIVCGLFRPHRNKDRIR